MGVIHFFDGTVITAVSNTEPLPVTIPAGSPIPTTSAVYYGDGVGGLIETTEATPLPVQVVGANVPNLFRNIAAASTVTVLNGAGVLTQIIINNTTAGAVTIYDNTAAAGTIIATLTAGTVGMVFPYNVAVGTGITVVTAAASNITVCYTV